MSHTRHVAGVALMLLSPGKHRMSGKPFLRRVGLVLDSDARGKFMSDFERALAASGEKGAAKMRRALKEQLDLTLAELNKKFREGSIGQDDYLKRKFEAEQAFVQSLSRGMDQLRAKGELTDGEFVKLARDLAKVGDQAERTAQQFEKMGHGGKSAAEATAAAMKHAMDLRIAGLQESHRRGDLTEEGFLRRKHEAETGYVNSMLHNLAQLRAQGRLTDAEFIRMAADIDRVGREANGTALQLQKMGQHGTQASRSIGLSIGQWFTGGGVFELGRRGIDMLLGTLETLGRKVVSVLMDAPKQALEADAVWDHLRSTVENLGIAYAGVAGNIDQAVQALYARAPIFDDDEIAAGLDKLLAGTRNYTWSVNNMGLVLDVAAREQMELGEAADFVTKVYNGQTRVLKGHNVVVREGETAMDALRRTTKGYAEREAQTFMGQLKAIQNDLGNLVEDLGRVEIAGADGATALGQASSAIADLSTGLRQNRAEVVHWIRVLVAGLSTAANFVVYQVRFILNMVTAYFRAVEIVYQGGMGAIDLFAENAISKLNVVIRAMNLLPGAVKIPEIPNTWGDAAERRVRRIAVLQRALQADFADMTRAAGNVGNSLRDFWKVLNEPLALPSVNASIDAVPHGSRTDPEGN
ncbi:MAG TPA: hypothetical protein VFJ16_24850, partial [Longimicrobium sp.]|nr:hypothetical protein [Longimicrobium sp.]